MEVPVVLVALLVLLSTMIPVEPVEGRPLSRRQHGASRKAAAARSPKSALRQLLTPHGQELGVQRTRTQQADEASEAGEGGGDPPQAPGELDGVLAPKFYPVGPAEPVEPGLHSSSSSESERQGGGGGREDGEQEGAGGRRGDDDDYDDGGRHRGGHDYDDYDSRRGGGGSYDERARAEQEQQEEEERRRQQESYDPYGGQRESYEGQRESYEGQRESYEGHRDPYGGRQEGYDGDHRRDPYDNEHNPYSSSRSYNPYHEYQQQQYERLREYQDRYMRMMEELGVPGVWVDGRFRRQDNADHEGVHEAYYAARGPYSRHPYDY